MSVKTKKKQNAFVSYFKPFGLRQICDILILTGAIVLFVGAFTSDIATAVGLGMYMLACVLAIVRAIGAMRAAQSKRVPEYKRALINLCIMSVILAIAIFTMVYIFVWL